MRRQILVMSGALAIAAGCTSGSAKDTPLNDGEGGSAASVKTEAGPESVSATSRDTAQREPTLKVVILGTSLTAGLGLDPGDAYPAVLQRMADSAGYAIEVVNAGLSGETSAGALRRIDWVLSNQRSDVVIIETGANDGLRGLDTDSTAENLREIARRTRRHLPNATVFLAQMEAPPNLGPAYTARFRDMFARVAREEGVILLPFLLDGVAGVAAMNQRDGIHPNEEGARRVAANVWASLSPELARLDPTVGGR